MARTFIGELILRLKDEMSGKAKEAASNLDTSVEKIQRAAERMNKTSWGGSFEEKLRKLGASSTDIDKLRTSWEHLNKTLAEKDVSKAMAAMEKANFKNASLGVFAELAARADTAESSISKMHRTMKDAMKDMAVWSATGALMYGGVEALRGGIKANAEYQREQFLEKNASIPDADRRKMLAEADRLTTKYPSAGLVNVLEMARTARGMMGSTERGLQILPDLVKGLVALQTSNTNPEFANDALGKLLRGIDNAGKNVAGPAGIKDTQEIIAGLIRASQIEGKEINVGDMWTFMRRAKIAGPGFSTEFIANVVPALVQDMGAPGAGTALSSDFQAYVIGSNAVASAKNIGYQKEIGIRTDDGLVNAKLMANNPYRWATEVLLPALEKHGVDVNDNAALAEAIAKTSRNTPATAMLTKMLQQRQQIDRTIEQYRNAIGPDSADVAAAEDPFVSMKGFVESWRELATAVRGMPEAVAGLNALTAGIQNFATALRNKDGWAQLGLAGAGAAGLFGAWKMTAGIWGLITAGTNLNAAAVALEAAAVSLGGAGVLKDVPGKAGKLSLLGGLGELAGNLTPWLARFSLPLGAAVTAYKGLDAVPHEGMVSALKDNSELMVQLANSQRQWQGVAFESGMHRAGRGAGPRPGSWENPTPLIVDAIRNAVGPPDDRDQSSVGANNLRGNRLAGLIYELMKPTADRLFEQVPARHAIANASGSPDDRAERNTSLVNPYAAALDYMERRRQMERETTPYNPNTPGLSQYFAQPAKPDIDMSALSAAEAEAARVGSSIVQALAVTGSPQVNNQALRETLALVNAIKAGLSGIGGAIQSARASVGSEMRRNFADHGVKL